MRPERLAEIDALFEEALELSGPARERRLAERTVGDPELRSEVEALLACAERSVAGLLEPVRSFAVQVGASAAEEPAPGEVVGAYRLTRRLGEGGMGVVFLAERVDGSFERQVALKLLPAAGADRESIRRFEQERRILARFGHPKIARLLDGGVDRRGLPYLVMEHVEGLPIDRHADERRLPIEARIALLVEVAEAVQAAHRNLIVHRDLKPSNVLVTAAGEVKLLDFGIAKILDPDRGDPAIAELTQLERRALTPSYASPEQVNGEPVSTASDVYQLGLLLYELLTGLRPQAATTSSLAELVELVCRREPTPPSRAVADAGDYEGSLHRAETRATTPAKLARRLRGELDAIVARAVAKAPAERYATPSDLAADLVRYLERRPVKARPASLAVRARKWVRRNAAVTALGAAVLVAVVGYAVTVTVQSRALDRQRVRAEREAATAKAVEQFLTELFTASDPQNTTKRDFTAQELLQRGIERVDAELASEPAVQARLWSALGQIERRRGNTDVARQLLGRALERQRELFGEENAEYALTLVRYSVLHRQGGERQRGREMLERGIELLRRNARPNSGDLAFALAELGNTKLNAGELAGAEAAFREGLAIHRANGAEGGISIQQGNLGKILLERGDVVGAERHLRESVAAKKRIYGAHGPRVAIGLFDLSSALKRQGRFEEALAVAREAAAIDRDLWGAGHAEYAADLNRIGELEQELGRLAESEATLDEALRILEALPEPPAMDLGDAEVAKGQIRVRQGRFAEGEALLRQGLARLESHYGPDARNLRVPLLWLGRSVAPRGRKDEAIAIWKRAAAIRPDLVDSTRARLVEELERAGANAPPAAQPAAGDSSSR
jgi:serine/threonine-protein kinase